MQIIWKLVGKRFRVRHRQSWLDPHRTFALGHCQQSYSRKRLSQLVVSQAVFTLLVIMQIIWKLVGKRFRVRHRQSWLDPHRTFALGHCQQSYSRKRLSQLVVSQAVFTLLVIMQIIWKVVGKRFRARHWQSWLNSHNYAQIENSYEHFEFSHVRYEHFEFHWSEIAKWQLSNLRWKESLPPDWSHK